MKSTAPLHLRSKCMNKQYTNLKHTHTHTFFNGHFPGEPGLAGCPLNSLPPFIPGLRIRLGQT